MGGKLKLKGGETLKPSGGVVKKKKKKTEESADAKALAETPASDHGGAGTSGSAGGEDLKKVLHGYELPSPTEKDDRRTEAERRCAWGCFFAGVAQQQGQPNMGHFALRTETSMACMRTCLLHCMHCCIYQGSFCCSSAASAAHAKPPRLEYPPTIRPLCAPGVRQV